MRAPAPRPGQPQLVSGARARSRERPLLDSFLQQFALSNEEGVALMCLAEGLLRIPDDETADRLIADKIASGNWAVHAGASHSTWVNASTWGLMLTGKLIEPPKQAREETSSWLQGLSRRISAPVLRSAFRQAMRIIGGEFVVGRTIQEALERSAKTSELSLCSFDMLGEGARTWADAERYRKSYEQALDAIGSQRKGTPIDDRSNLSVKLSALEPKYDLMHDGLVMQRLAPIVTDLARRAAAADVGFTIDAEEADRLDLSLNVFEALARDQQTQSWKGLGIVIQAYGKRAPDVIEWVASLARETGRRICVRLVKGAYWDAEIKRAQERGLVVVPRVHAQRCRRTFPISPMPSACSSIGMSFTRCSQLTTRTPSPPFWNCDRLARSSSSSACTAWARCCTTKRSDRSKVSRAFAPTRPSASTRSCCLTSCAGCWRTARTARSSTAS